MGCGTTREKSQPIAYQRDLLGACWNSQYGEHEAKVYIRSRWLGLSKTVMELHTGNQCFSFQIQRRRDSDETVGGTPAASPRDAGVSGGRPQQLLDDQLPEDQEMMSSPVGALPSMRGFPRHRSMDNLNGPQGDAATLMNRAGDASPRTMMMREKHGKHSHDQGSLRAAVGASKQNTAHSNHPYLRAHGLSVSSGVAFSAAPARRRYDRIAFVPSAYEEATKHTRPVALRDRSSSVTSAMPSADATPMPMHHLPLPAHNLPLPLTLGPSDLAAAHAGAASDDPLRPENNYSIVDEDVPTVKARTPPVIVGSVTAMELLTLPPNAEVCLGGWLYVSLQDEQRRLRKSLDAYRERRQQALEKNNTSRRRRRTVRQSVSGAFPPQASRRGSDYDPLAATMPVPTGRSVSMLQRFAPSQQADDDREETWLPYAYILIALPMYECTVRGTAFHQAFHRPRNISMNIASAMSRKMFGVGCITRVRYGGVMVIEYRDRVSVADEQWVRRLIALGREAEARYKEEQTTAASPPAPAPASSPPAATPASDGVDDMLFTLLMDTVNHPSTSAGGRQRLESLHAIKRRIRARLRRAGVHVVNADTRLEARRKRSVRHDVHEELSMELADLSEDKEDSDDDNDRNSLRVSESESDSEAGGSASNLQRHHERVFQRRRPTRVMRGTFRQVGGMRYLDAASLMEGCPVSEVVTAVERWILNLLRVPIKARPLSLFLQRYEGIANCLRVATSNSVLRNQMGHGSSKTAVLLANGSFNPVVTSSFAGSPQTAWASSFPSMGSPHGSFVNASFLSVGVGAGEEARPRAMYGDPFYMGPLWRNVVPVLSPALGNMLQGYKAPPRRITPASPSLPVESRLNVGGQFTLLAPLSSSPEALSIPHSNHNCNNKSSINCNSVTAPPPPQQQSDPTHTQASSSLGHHSAVSKTPYAPPSTIEQFLLHNPVLEEDMAAQRHIDAAAGILADDAMLSPVTTSVPAFQSAATAPLPGRFGSDPGKLIGADTPASDNPLSVGSDALWKVADKELRALKSELDELQHLVSNAHTELLERVEECMILGSIFLPHTRMDQLQMKMVFLKTLRQYPEDVPIKELSSDWLPGLYALLTTDDKDLLPNATALCDGGGGGSDSRVFNMILNQDDDMCDANRLQESIHDVTTKYAFDGVPVLPPAQARLRDVTIAPKPYRLTASVARSLQQMGLDSGLSFTFTGGSLGVLAGLLRYYSDYVESKYRICVERLRGPGVGPGVQPSLKDYAKSAVDLLEKEHQVLLQRVSIWGASLGSSKTRNLNAFMKVHERFCNSVDADDDVVDSKQLDREAAEHAALVGIPFRGAECFALFDAIAHYLHTLDALQREFTGDYESHRPVKRRSILGPFFNKNKGDKQQQSSAHKRSRSLNASIVGQPENEPIAAASQPASSRSPLHYFDLCIVSNHYDSLMKDVSATAVAEEGRAQSLRGAARQRSGNTTPLLRSTDVPVLERKASAQQQQRRAGASKVKREDSNRYHNNKNHSHMSAASTSKGPASGGGGGGGTTMNLGAAHNKNVSRHVRKAEVPYCGGQESKSVKEVRRWRKHNKQLFKFVSEHLDKWKAHRSQDWAGDYAKRIRISYV